MNTSSQPNPPKLNYAKARGKSKTKNDIGSQQKIPLQPESGSDNIFAHLNQDNLNYIKKQLKNKKSLHNHERAKSSNINSSQFISTKSQEVRYSSTQRQKQPKQSREKEILTTIQQQKMYEKYKNQNQVTQRDSREQETMRQTEVDQEVLSQIDNAQKQQSNTQRQISSYSQKNQLSSQIHKQKDKTIHNKVPILKPPPLTLKTYKESLPSTQSQHVKTASLQTQLLQADKQKSHHIIGDNNSNNNINLNTTSKHNFLQYQLKSQNSHNQITNSVLSAQNQLSEQYTNLKASQFIDYLQSYIEQLQSSPYSKQKRRAVSKPTPQYNKQSIVKDSDDLQSQNEYSYKNNFKKNKNAYFNQFNQSHESKISKSCENNYMSTRNYFHNQSNSLKNTIQQNFQQVLSKPTQRNTQNSKYLTNDNLPHPHDVNNYRQNLKQNYKDIAQKQLYLQQLHEQLETEKYHCKILATELEKYKKNQDKNQKQIKILNKTLNLMRIQMQSLKQMYKRQAQQTNFMLKKFELRVKEQKRSNHKSSRRRDSHSNNQTQKQYFYEFQRQAKRDKKTKDYTKNILESYNQQQEDNYKNDKYVFTEFMKFSYNEPIYNQLNKNFYNKLQMNFQKGKLNFYKDKKNQQNSALRQSHYNSQNQNISYRKKYTKVMNQYNRTIHQQQPEQLYSRKPSHKKKQINQDQDQQALQLQKLLTRSKNKIRYNSKQNNNSQQIAQKINHTYRQRYNDNNIQIQAKGYLSNKYSNINNKNNQASHQKQRSYEQQKSSLQKLKEQYTNFKNKIKRQKMQQQSNSKFNQKIHSYTSNNMNKIRNSQNNHNFRQKSPKQFSHIFVK